ncbi:N-acetyltransferase [Pontibacter diazotrophicus]|uniref:N-acetyltransferase n=1 Tax=Pontibacter diazotrophicus TaxID=1400979 RepID=A0A3D8LEC1_9BACT|nr:GNAT family N-acetyltransferase [Pontibacter diazotrophicus]RDV15624.1 N-acetyltransferase [Pontibacter diazotrophicus]
MSAATIYTDRLILIPFTLATTRFLLAGDTSILNEIGLQITANWPDQEAIETLPKILRNLELVQEPTGFESWMIVLKSKKTVIGDAGFKGRPNAEGEVDIGYAIIEQEHKKGYGMEAAKALTDWAFQQPEVRAVTAKCLISNTASARILEKLGLQKTNRDDEMIHWSVIKPNQHKLVAPTI